MKQPRLPKQSPLPRRKKKPQSPLQKPQIPRKQQYPATRLLLPKQNLSPPQNPKL